MSLTEIKSTRILLRFPGEERYRIAQRIPLVPPRQEQVRTHSDDLGRLANSRPRLARQAHCLRLELLAVILLTRHSLWPKLAQFLSSRTRGVAPCALVRIYIMGKKSD